MKTSITRFFVCALLATALPLAAAPRLWVESVLDPASSPIYAQATYVLRFGHAVDVRAPRLTAPTARLAEVLPLGELAEREETRDGLRYRVLERRFAILPFASGDLDLQGEVAGTTPALLSEIAGKRAFVLAAPPRRLVVAPSRDDVLPAVTVKFSAGGEPPADLRVGGVWTRRIEVAAVGVDGAAITLPAIAAASDAAGWRVQADVPEVGRRIEQDRVVGFLRQNFHFQPRRSGTLEMPEFALAYRPPGTSALRSERVPAVRVTVVPDPDADVGTQQPNTGPSHWALAFLAGLSGFGVIAAYSRRHWRPVGARFWRLHLARREVVAACRAGDPARTRAALLAYAAVCGARSRSLSDLAGDRDDLPWRQALADLDAACFAPEGAPGWSATAIRQGLRRWRPAAAKANILTRQ